MIKNLVEDKDTILFDLDGTLLPIDIDKFLKYYFRLLTEEFSDIAEADNLINVLMSSTEKMIKNDGDNTNQQVFINSFFNMIEVENKDDIMLRFDKFYQEKFPLLKEKFALDRRGLRIVEPFKKQGYKLVIATNPLFPLEAIQERVRWTGLAPATFDFITSYETMHYSKPDPGFFEELMDKLDTVPDRCIMVGNDMQEDIIAGKLGITTLLIEDFLIDRNNSELKPDWQGSLQEYEEYVEKVFC